MFVLANCCAMRSDLLRAAADLIDLILRKHSASPQHRILASPRP
jgi:hypothetical protein